MTLIIVLTFFFFLIGVGSWLGWKLLNWEEEKNDKKS